MNEPRVLRSLRADGRGLRMYFVAGADRIQHHVEWVSEDGPLRLLSSVEPTDLEAAPEWPVSPPWQQISLEKHDGRAVVLLLGMAGKSHWSCSIQALAAGERVRIAVDVACRIQTPPVGRAGREHRLGSCYELGPGIIAAPIPAGLQLVRDDRCIGRFVRPDHAPENTAEFTITGRRVWCGPQPPAAAPATVCWSYQFES